MAVGQRLGGGGGRGGGGDGGDCSDRELATCSISSWPCMHLRCDDAPFGPSSSGDDDGIVFISFSASSSDSFSWPSNCLV